MLKKILFFITAVFLSNCIYSQKVKRINAPLKEVLLLLEKDYQIKFSYADDVITNKTISIFLGESLQSDIQEIESKTLLRFKKLSERYYSINKSIPFFCGYVKDINSKEVLKGASITFNGKVFISDENGYFKINNISQNETIKISFVGYATKSIRIKNLQKECINVYLLNNTSILNEVLITDYLTTGISKKKDGALIIKPQKLGILPGLVEPDVLQSLQLFPGIQSPNETVAGIHVRGGTPDQNLILYDGIKIYNAAHFFGMISAFNPYTTDQITLYKAASSPEYGNHVSGVIDIKSNETVPESFSGGFGANLTHADIFTKIPITKKLGVNISARRSFTDIISTETIKKISQKVFQNTIIESNNDSDLENVESSDDFNFVDYNLKINYKISENETLSLSHLFTENELDYLFNFEDDLFITNDNLNIKNYGFNTNWKKKFTNTTSLTTNVFYSKYNFDYKYIGEINFQDDTFLDGATKKNTIKNGGLKSFLNFNFNTKNSLKIGYEYNHNTVNYTLGRTYVFFSDFNYSFNSKEKTNNHALFSEYNFTNNLFNIHLGLRLNHFSLSNTTFLSPRINWKAAIDDNLWVKSSIEAKQQNISQLIEFTTSDFGLENQIWVLSDDDAIPVLKSNQYTLGLVYNNDRWIFDIDFYSKNIKGLTSFIDGFNNIQDVFSKGESTITGIDILLKKSFNNYNTWFSYNYQNLKYKFEDIDNGNVFPGNFDIRHNLTWTHNLKVGNFNFSLGWNYRTGLPYTKAQGLNSSNLIDFDLKNRERLSDYNRVDVSSTYSFNFSNKWKAKIGVSILNVFDKNNTLRRDHEVNFDNSGIPFINRIDNVSQGITPNAVFRVTF